MKLSEVRSLLDCDKNTLRRYMDKGLYLKRAKTTVRLEYSTVRGIRFVSDAQYNAFVRTTEENAPGRYPDVEIVRVLIEEAQYRCAFCREKAPFQFHHIVEWSRIKHHDPKNMMAVCGTCHSRCGNGEYGTETQRRRKKQLVRGDLNILAIDPQTETRRAHDLATIKDIWTIFPMPLVEFVLDSAEEGRIPTQTANCLLALRKCVLSSDFYLYDRKLDKSLRKLLRAWFKALYAAENFFTDDRGTGIATLDLTDFSPPDEWARHSKFIERIRKARAELVAITARLRETQPTFNLTKSNRLAVRKFKQAVEEAHRQVLRTINNVDERIKSDIEAAIAHHADNVRTRREQTPTQSAPPAPISSSRPSRARAAPTRAR